MHQYKKLRVWQLAVDLTIEIYRLSDDLPVTEKYGIQSQMRRAAVSIPSNIAEGAGRNSKGEWKHFLGIANGSAFELSTHLLICDRLELMPRDDIRTLSKSLDQLQNMIFKLISSISGNT